MMLVNNVAKIETMAKTNYKRKKEHMVVKNVTATQKFKTTTNPTESKHSKSAKLVNGAQKLEEKTKCTSKTTKENSNVYESTSSSESATSTPKFEAKSRFNSKPKILYVADSVGHTASLRKIETACNARVVSDWAYSSVPDPCARWQELNFKDVVEQKLKNSGRENFDTLVMSAPTVDISNLDTSRLKSNDSTHFYKQRVIQSSRNMFNLAHAFLEQNTNLRKVVIMEHPPRFDDRRVDPISLKPSLRALANATLYQLLDYCSMKDRIFIGSHSLECAGIGATHEARYQD